MNFLDPPFPIVGPLCEYVWEVCSDGFEFQKSSSSRVEFYTFEFEYFRVVPKICSIEFKFWAFNFEFFEFEFEFSSSNNIKFI